MPESEIQSELAAALDALRALHDMQNGPPLEKWRAEWEAAMANALAIMTKHNR